MATVEHKKTALEFWSDSDTEAERVQDQTKLTNPNSSSSIEQQKTTHSIQKKPSIPTFTNHIQHFIVSDTSIRHTNKAIDTKKNKPVLHQSENLPLMQENPSKMSQGQRFPNKEIHHNRRNITNQIENANHIVNQSEDFPPHRIATGIEYNTPRHIPFLPNNTIYEPIPDITYGDSSAATGSTSRITDIEEFLLSQRTSFLEHQRQEDGLPALESKPSTLPFSISIGTHNVRGITRSVDQTNLIEELLERKIDIMGLSETKLSQESQCFAFQEQTEYKCFSSAEPNNPRSAGVLLLIRKNIERYIASVDKIDGHLIAINLLNRGYKTWIAQIYLPSDKKRSQTLQKKIQDLLQTYRQKNYEVIIMGDFNAVVDPRTDRKTTDTIREFVRPSEPESKLFHYMTNWNLIDLQHLWESTDTTHTWKNKASSSRIDYMWGSYGIANNMLQFNNEDFRSISNSDHTMLSIQITRNTMFKDHQTTTNIHKPRREKIINLSKTTKVQWKKYMQKVDQKLQQSDIQYQIQSMKSNLTDNNKRNQLVQETWKTFEKVLIASAFNYLHCEKRTVRGPNRLQTQKRSHREKDAFYSYRLITKVVSNWSELNDPVAGITKREKLWEECEKINKNIAPIAPVFKSSYDITEAVRGKEEENQLKLQLRETAKTLKKICINEERNRTNAEIKEAIQKRCRNLKENQRKVVQGLTNNFRSKISIDRIRIQDDLGEEYISVNKEEILRQTEAYYKNAFKKRNCDFELLDEEWKKQYEPIEEVKEEWYNSMKNTISECELEEALKDLPNDKAAGPNKVKYEMLKNLGTHGKRILCQLMNVYLTYGITPATWKESLLYPISKGKEWQGILSNTRPIILLDVSRKCFTKIITSRLSAICKTYNILKGPNFAGLPGECTSEPIHLINNICEEAREKNKELWILFQDTAKAYDTISLDMLRRALLRIKVPANLTTLILDLFINRSIQIITDMGITEKIVAGDGIDQGETISPLLWRIFYDPLLCEIQKKPQLGYSMNCEWKSNLSKEENTQHLTVRQAAIAYMDDTTWIARSAEDMENILERAKWFYAANDSQINGSKSVLITINSRNKEPNSVRIGIDQQEVIESDRSSFTRFLGIWIGSRKHTKDTVYRIRQEIEAVIPILKRKKITDKQVEYIVNRVLIPRIEYRMQHCFIEQNICNKLTVQLRKVLKQAAGVVSTIPNSTIHHKKIYNIKSIEEIQAENQISNLLNRLNDTGPAGISTLIRLKQAQIQNWEPSNILTNKISRSFKCSKNFSAQVLKAANNMGITIFNSRWTDNFDWKGGSLSIKNKLNDTKLYFKAVPSLRKHNIMFMDQLVDRDTKTILPWKIIQILSNSSKGPTPSWFKTVKSLCANEYGVLNEKWQNWDWEEQDRKFFSKNLSRDRRRWSWKIIAKDEDCEEILWYRNKGNLNFQDPQTEVYHAKRGPKLDSTKLQRVEITPLSNTTDPIENPLDRINPAGGNKRSQNMPLAIEILNQYPTLRKSSEPEIPISLHVLENQAKKALKSFTERGITNNRMRAVEIEDFGIQIIKDHIHSPEYIQALIKEYRMNRHSNYQQTYCFYTDGSFGKARDKTLRMGAAWLQEKGPNPGRSFQAGVDNWPSALRAELVAIILTLMVVPQKSQIEIRTDNITCINTLQTLQNPRIKDTGKRNRKRKNWQLWMRCIDIIQKKQITVQMTKVKAHSKDTSNNKVDLLAKEAKEEPEITWTKWYRQEALTTLCWNEIPIDTGAREFIKELHKRGILMKWAGQNRIQKRWLREINDHENFDWRGFWEANRVGGALETSLKKTREKSFRIKMMHNELPTLDNMNKRFPKEYGNLINCIYCRKEKESLEHLLSCPDILEIRKEIWNETKDLVLNKWSSKTQEGKNKDSRIHISTLLAKWYTSKFSQGKDIIDFSLGLFQKIDITEWISAMAKLKIKKGEAKFLLHKLSRSVCKQVRKKIWNDRCSRLQDSGEKPEMKKHRKGNRTKAGKKEKRAGPEEQEEHEAKDPADQEEAMNEEPNHSQEQNEMVIWRWIKEGKKWLGI